MHHAMRIDQRPALDAMHDRTAAVRTRRRQRRVAPHQVRDTERVPRTRRRPGATLGKHAERRRLGRERRRHPHFPGVRIEHNRARRVQTLVGFVDLLLWNVQLGGQRRRERHATLGERSVKRVSNPQVDL
jgi:hypothetical protein